MRSNKFDQIREANILAEQRYMATKNTSLPFNLLNESKQTELQALSILKKGGAVNPESVVAALAKDDKSKNQKNLSIMAFMYLNWTMDVRDIADIMNSYDELEMKQRLPKISLNGTSLMIKDKTFNEFIKFSEFIHGEENKYTVKAAPGTEVEQVEAEDEPMWSGNNIDIYEGIGVGKCIKYTQGSLTGRGYSFCIGQPGNRNYQGYRDTKDSSFYFIIDKNKFKTTDTGVVLDDPLHIVVFDMTRHGIELTDANNRTGHIAEYDDDSQGYVDYLESMDVPVDKLINRVKTPEEVEEQRLLGDKNVDLQWFKNLSIDYKSKYIGRGHLLSDEQFDYLLS